jgi:hypothetical protein
MREEYCYSWNEEGDTLTTKHVMQKYIYWYRGMCLGDACDVCEWEMFDGTRGVYQESTRVIAPNNTKTRKRFKDGELIYVS